jgi:SlyX protein
MEQRIIDVEVKIAFLEETLDTLNDVLLEQSKTLEQLKRKLDRLEQRVGSAGEDVGPQDERPPHY